MIPYQKQKIDNAICYFAFEHHKRTRNYLTQTYLYKYLAFLDFESFEKRGRPALGLKYIAWKKGPVPIEIYNLRDKLKTDCYEFVKSKIGDLPKDVYFVIAHGKPNMDYFSDFEISIMQKLIEIYADSFVKSKEMSEASHERIKAWKKTWERKPNSTIDYALTFDGDPSSKPKDNLTFAEDCYLTSKVIESY